MKINSIKLNNIRSYTNQEINFPEGSILLSGNIGSGKTSLLLAMDFVLFGLRKGSLSGNSLLRKGEDNGSVELNFQIKDKNIVIKRTLKRTSKGINQSSGYFNNEELSPIEIKQRVIDLFNYPTDSLKKTKDLIYNYTIYTPQEEMKSILLSDSEDRLNILRKVFGIDKYKRVIENSKILTTNLKEKKNEFSLLSEDLDKVKLERENKQNRINEINSFLENLNKDLEEIRKLISLKKVNLEELEEKSKKREEIKKNLEILNNKLESLIDQKSKDNLIIEKLGEEINLLDKELKEFKIIDIEKINKNILDIEKDIRNLDIKNNEINKKIGEFDFIINNSNKLKDNIKNLKVCPTCKQEVKEEHKHHISNVEDIKLKEAREEIDLYKRQEEENIRLILELKNKLENYKKEKNNTELFKIKKANLEDKRNRLNSLLQEQTNIKEKIGSINSQKIGYNKLLETTPDISNEYHKIKEELEEILEKERKLNSEFIANEREVKLVNERIQELNNEIEKKLEFKEKIIKYSKIIDYLDKEFISLISLMEKQIMKKVHSDFDKLFRDWFKILVENEDLEISLDYDFSTLIRQNGYDAEYNHLSGGERTAAALAYRLALNQVINTIMSDINTKDILILDEPTDGFSSEQVDKLREILEELNIKQIIVVSHDPKIESFVDNVIRFEKKEGTSFVV